MLENHSLSLVKEIDSIVKEARKSKCYLLIFGYLLLFSTVTRDVWIIDLKNDLGLKLAEDGKKLIYEIEETETGLKVGWSVKFFIDSDEFIVCDSSGTIGVYYEYPTDEILQILKQAKI